MGSKDDQKAQQKGKEKQRNQSSSSSPSSPQKKQRKSQLQKTKSSERSNNNKESNRHTKNKKRDQQNSSSSSDQSDSSISQSPVPNNVAKTQISKEVTEKNKKRVSMSSQGSSASGSSSSPDNGKEKKQQDQDKDNKQKQQQQHQRKRSRQHSRSQKESKHSQKGEREQDQEKEREQQKEQEQEKEGTTALSAEEIRKQQLRLVQARALMYETLEESDDDAQQQKNNSNKTGTGAPNSSTDATNLQRVRDSLSHSEEEDVDQQKEAQLEKEKEMEIETNQDRQWRLVDSDGLEDDDDDDEEEEEVEKLAPQQGVDRENNALLSQNGDQVVDSAAAGLLQVNNQSFQFENNTSRTDNQGNGSAVPKSIQQNSKLTKGNFNINQISLTNKFQNEPVEEEEQEIDILDAYLQDLTGQKIDRPKKQNFNASNYGGFEDIEEPNNNQKPQNVMTQEEFYQMMYGENDDQKEGEKSQEADNQGEESEDDQDFHNQFLEAMKNQSLSLQEQQQKEGFVDDQLPGSQVPETKSTYQNKGVFLEQDDDNDQLDAKYEEQIMAQEKQDFLTRQQKLNESKELHPVDPNEYFKHSFRQNFYVESKEVAEMNQQEVTQYRLSLGDVKVRGLNVPNPVKNWYQCGLNDRILYVLIEKKKYEKPFAIQAQSIPVVMSGRDTIGIAETGSGKTLAYILPMLRHILDQPPLEQGDGPISLILSPTRELSHQIYVECKSFCRALNLNAACVYGGAGVAGQLSDLKKGAEIVVCTPGRFIDVLTTSNGKITNLQRVTYVVIDEADRMFDLGFAPQIQKILDSIRPDRQTVMFSATFPRNVQNLAQKILHNPVEIVVGSRGQACANIDQYFQFLQESGKLIKLLEILEEWKTKGSIIIFVDKQTEADELFQELVKFQHQLVCLHGGMDPTDREFAIYDFQKGVYNMMVATSVCARGLDIKSIVLVLNFSCPNHLEDYIHRIGRTGRAGNKGTAITFIMKSDEQYSNDLMKAIQLSNQEVPEKLIEMVEEFKQQVERGEARVYGNKISAGRGFKFNEDQAQKTTDQQKALEQQINRELGLSQSESDEQDIFLQQEKKEQQEQEQKKRPSHGQEKTLKEKLQSIKDPNAKNAIMQEALQSAQIAIQAGKSNQEVNQAATNAFILALKEYRPTAKTLASGIQEASRMLEEFQRNEEINNEVISYDFEINDYPANARQKVINQDFLNTVKDLTNSNVSLRGMYVEPGKQPPPGQKKMYLHIESETQYSVVSAYKEIQRIIEEAATRFLNLGGSTHAPGKYTI